MHKNVRKPRNNKKIPYFKIIYFKHKCDLYNNTIFRDTGLHIPEKVLRYIRMPYGLN